MRLRHETGVKERRYSKWRLSPATSKNLRGLAKRNRKRHETGVKERRYSKWRLSPATSKNLRGLAKRNSATA